ncbi:hypothetical protein Acel_0098 [Acidothermus cellulolyticus 11B]|uniref:LytR/CpsA/Psr regulator C-terminal domain-containing protein n=2 Tax=Acidothermus cellulolyticus TaxID=28049 RepID=A0LR14_ACIC1|nr:hypothetical protein Acel_0098 [Acidothermus cellulolyticus 11B]
MARLSQPPGVPPRSGGAHRARPTGHRGRRLLGSFLAVAIAGFGVWAALTWRNPSRPAESAATRPASATSASAISSAALRSTGPTPSPTAGSSTSEASTATPSSADSTVPSSPSVSMTRPVVDVLNNSRIRGLAAKAAKDVQAAGWTIGTVGNYSAHVLPATTVFYPAGERDAAEQLAAEFHIRQLSPADPQMSGAHLTLVVTRDWDTLGG